MAIDKMKAREILQWRDEQEEAKKGAIFDCMFRTQNAIGLASKGQLLLLEPAKSCFDGGQALKPFLANHRISIEDLAESGALVMRVPAKELIDAGDRRDENKRLILEPPAERPMDAKRLENLFKGLKFSNHDKQEPKWDDKHLYFRIDGFDRVKGGQLMLRWIASGGKDIHMDFTPEIMVDFAKLEEIKQGQDSKKAVGQ